MGLQVWMPLNGDLHNQGLDNSGVFTISPTYGVGKIGAKAMHCDVGVSLITFNNLIGVSEFSIAYWLYIDSSVTNFSNYADFWEVQMTSGNTTSVARDEFRTTNTTDIGMHAVHIIKDTTVGGNTNNYYYFGNRNTAKDKWCHIVLTKNADYCDVYENGIRYGHLACSNIESIPCTLTGKIALGTSGCKGAYLNDFRIYDHCLSPMEVKELAKGLVLHYPLSDNSIQSLDNCYAYPRFETSNSNGGWSHWGSSGHVGTYGQTTDTNYIFRNGQTYAHWVADGSSATKDYLLYQEPAFDGGLRSLVAICKEENSKPITNDICYATWNARNGGVANNSWTSIQSLGNGFYLCKCEGISQDGSNDLVGIYIKPGYKVYFSEVYLENNRSISSDMFFPTNIVYDCSGFCNNGTKTGTFTCSSDTPKYQVSSKIAAASTGIKTPNFYIGDVWSMSVWFKYPSQDSTSWKALVILNNSGGDADLQFGNYINCSGNQIQYSANGKYTTGVSFTYGEWHHVVNTYNGTTLKCYLDGVYKTSVTPGQTLSRSNLGIGFKSSAVDFSSVGASFTNGFLSDVRIYATALSADDVKSLYQNSAYIDSSGNVYGTIHEV